MDLYAYIVKDQYDSSMRVELFLRVLITCI